MTTLRVFSFLIIIFCGGCATKPTYQVAPTVPKGFTHVLGRNVALGETNHTVSHLNGKKDIIFFQNFGGGGAGLGLLLGPLGVAANIKMIGTKTEEDASALFGKILADIEKSFRLAAAETSINFDQDSSKKAVISPYLYVTKMTENELAFAAAILVDLSGVGEQWLGKYMYQLPMTHNLSTAKQGLSEETQTLLKDQLNEGFQGVVELYLNDKAGQLGSGTSTKFKSNFIYPRFNAELIGDRYTSADNRVIIRTAGAMYSLPRNAVTITKN